MMFKCVCKSIVPYMSQEEILFTTEITAPTLEAVREFFICEYGKEKYDSLFDRDPCEVYFG